MIVIPEIIILNSLKTLIDFIRTDYAANSADTTKSLLYRVLAVNSVQRYSMFEQAKAVFITKTDNPRHLDVNMFFNAKRASIPTIHITLPSESEKNNALNNSEGFRDPIYTGGTTESPENFIRTFNRRFGSRYNIIISSDNSTEVILIYHFIRSTLISMNEHWNMSGLENPKLGGGDLNINSDIIPPNVFMRSIGIDFEYDVEAIELTGTGTSVSIFDIKGVDSVPNEVT